MSVDYKAIADEIEAQGYSDYEAAFIAMSQETVSAFRDLSGHELRVWAALNPDDYTNLKAAAASNVTAEIAVQLVATPDSVLSMTDPIVRGMIEAFKNNEVFSQTGRDALFTKASIETPKWVGLKREHVKKALRLRTEGEV